MEEADDYVPQISQIDYNGSGGGAPGYYDPAMSAGMFNADPQHQFQRHPSMGAGGNPMMGGYPNASAAQMHGQMGGHPMGMNPAMMSAPQPPAQPPAPAPPAAKPKRGGRKKATAAQAAEANQPPVQQPLQPSFPPSQPMNPVMMQQMRQQTPQNPYGAPQYGTSQGYPPQAQKWAPDYNQMQYRPPVPPSYMQSNYSMQQGAPQGYYPGQQRPPHYNPYQYPNQHFPPQQGWHPNMQQQHVGQYPQQQPQNAHGQMQQPPQYPAQNLQASHAQQPHGQKPEMGAPSSAAMSQQQSQYNAYQQHSKIPASMPPAQSQMSPYPPQQSAPPAQAPNAHWQSPYNGASVPPGYYAPQTPNSQQMSPLQSIGREIVECERQYGYWNNHPKTPEITMRLEQLQQKISYLQHQQRMLQQQAQQQQVAPAQAPQKTPQPPPVKNYPAYSSNGQMPDPTSSQPMPTISTASTVHIPPEQTAVRRPDSSATAGSSVSVMQTAPNQVQVNITPEAPGRTLISVYHQYPTADVMTTSHNSIGTTATTQSGKDSIPPEPIPSASLASNPDVYSRQFPVSSAPSTSTVNSTITTESKPKEATGGEYAAYGKKPEFSPVPPQPVPTVYGEQTQRAEEVTLPPPLDSAVYPPPEQPKTVAESVLAVNTEPFAEELAIEKVENQSAGPSAALESNGDRAAASPPTEIPTESEEKAEEEASFDADDFKPPAAPRNVATFEEDDEDEEMDTSFPPPEQEERAASPVRELPTETPEISASPIAEVLPQEAAEVNGEPEEEPKLDEEVETPALEEMEATTSTAPVLEPHSRPLSSIGAAETPLLEEEPLEVTPKAAKKKSTPKGRTPKGKKTPASRKRKKPVSADELSDAEDMEFIVESKKKKVKPKPTTSIESAEIGEPMLDDFVEKRRSERNRTERKTYNEKMDIDEELEELAPLPESADASPPEQPAAPELVVEKILGFRTVTRLVPKEVELPPEEEPPKANGTEEPSGESNGEKPTDGEATEQAEEQPKVADAEQPVEDPAKEAEEKSAEAEEPETSAEQPTEKKPEEEKEVEMEEVEVEEIFVKFKGHSYMHCAWKTLEELEAIDRRIAGKITRFKQKYGDAYLDDQEYFNEDFLLVDRVLDEHHDEEAGEHLAFVKWRSLPYEDCTWEAIDIVPQPKLDEFHRRNDKIDPCKAKERARPTEAEWTKIPSDKKYKDENTLRDYQFEGVNWLLFCYYNKRNCILADEMGLGKTIQTITFLQEVHDKGIHGPFLIVVPLSTLHNWEREFETWTDMNAVVYHGSAASREVLQEYELYYRGGDPKKKQIPKFDALLTTYEMIVSDCEVLRRINYRVCVIDEAHRLKNRNSKLLTAGLLSFKLEHRVLLTGTPLQNNIDELFSLLNFLEPEQFSSSQSFLEQFGSCQTEAQVQELQAILKPMMLRRLKEDVEKSLQPKEETIIEVQLSDIQKKYYRAILERNFSHLLKGTHQPSLLNALMELRKCCNHPFLIKGAEEQILSELRPLHADKTEDELQLHALIQASGKLVLLDKLLPKLKKDGHKVLIFSQMVKVLDLLEEYIAQMGYKYERIDGNIRGDMRQAAIDRFCKPDSDRFAFLLCTRAGGLGINLVAADICIIFDSDWNPFSDLQAQARCHRIGQKKMVKIYRLITTNTYEREMLDKASLKLGLDKAILQSMNPRDNQQMTKKEIEDLLRKGAYGAVMDEDNEGSNFNEEDIDTILQRRTQTIKLEAGVKGGTFAKATFTSSNNEDIDINDPNFWAKWAQKANVEMDAGKETLIVSEPRSRRKRFEENYKGMNEGESEEGDGTDEEGGEPGASKKRGGPEFSKSRSGKKRRRGDDDDDYVNYTPDELTFNKSEYFKVEKLLSAWGWGRWKAIKEHSDTTLSEADIEHISRTLLLHCIREYRGDEKCREFVWQLIIPENGSIGKGGKKGVIGGGLYHEGWAALPEYNPPAFAVDLSFQRHVHRHANKLLQRMFQLFVLQAHLISQNLKENILQEKPHNEIEMDVPTAGDPPLPNWDFDCDKSFLIGIYKHGMENFEQMRSDPKLCFMDKGIEEMPTTIELNTRFKRIVVLLSKKLEMAVSNAQNAARWPRAEEAEFMRLLRIYGVKDDHEGHNVINWNRFREMSSNLHRKTDAEMLEELYCVLAMCTKQQGGELSDVDRRRAAMVDPLPTAQAERLMFRLHLMRKIHAIITTGIHNVRTSLKLCSQDTMYPGWGELQDEQLMIVVDSHGIDKVAEKVSRLPAFEKFAGVLDEASLLRRVMEICTTLETGRWNGKASIAMLDDDGTLEGGNAQLAALQKAMAAVASQNAATPSRSAAQQQKRGRKKLSTSAQPTAVSAAASSQNAQLAAAQALMEAAMSNPNYLLPLLGAQAPGSSSSSQQQQQQLQAMLTMAALSSMMPGTSGSPNSAANKQAMMALAAMMGGEDALNLSVAPKKPPAPAKPAAAPAAQSTSKSTAAAQQAAADSALLELFQLLQSQDMNIPVVNSKTGAKLSGEKAPKVKNLEAWLTAHPDFKVDTAAMGGSTAPSSSKDAPPKLEKSTEGTSSNGTAAAHPPALEPGELPKASSSSATASSSKKTTVAETPSVSIGLFNKSTGLPIPSEKCPTVFELASYLDKNPDANVQSAFASVAKTLLPKNYHDRIGGESVPTSNAASASLQNAAASAAAANMLPAGMNSMEALQMQLLMSQLMMAPSSFNYATNPYAALLGGSGTSSGLPSGLTSAAGGMDPQAAALAALLTGQLPAVAASTPQTTPSVKNSSSTVASSTRSAAAASNSTANATAAMTDAITAEILANPGLAALFMGGAGMTNNNSSMSNLSSSAFPFQMDLNTALQLQALSGANGLGALASPMQATTSTPASASSQPAASTPAAAKKPSTSAASSTSRPSKLNAVLEKLTSSTQNATNNS